MPAPQHLSFELGRVYRTKELSQWSTNPSRLARRLVANGTLEPLAHGLFVHPRRGRFGAVPPTDEALMRAFLEESPYLFTGPEQWNVLGLGTTAVFPARLVYNQKRSGEFILGGRKFLLRRIPFPRPVPPEWWVVDLIEHHEMAGLSLMALCPALSEALARGRFDDAVLLRVARVYGTRRTYQCIEQALLRSRGASHALHS
ncbi:MAG: hypothetical protein ACKO6N_12205 [Myxococcota bacterium]